MVIFTFLWLLEGGVCWRDAWVAASCVAMGMSLISSCGYLICLVWDIVFNSSSTFRSVDEGRVVETAGESSDL